MTSYIEIGGEAFKRMAIHFKYHIIIINLFILLILLSLQ